MIHITRPNPVPHCLVTRGVDKTKLDCDEYDVCPDDYRLGRKLLNAFDRNIYADPSVKAALYGAHHGKCCYCEMKYAPAYLHVEHFRPKSGIRQRRNQKDDHPGYYWLAYVWENLLLACHQCNSVQKKTLFPLANPSVRPAGALSHHYDISLEEPLLIDPATDEPRDHIQFEGSSPKGLTPHGRTTIRELGLRKSTIAREKRMVKHKHLRMCLGIVEAHQNDPTNPTLRRLVIQARKDLTVATKPEAEFSSMAQDLLRGWRP
jgi:uncharacterized protein (TIGR02646 family)